MKRQKTQYPGVFFKMVQRVGGKRAAQEKSYYIVFKKDGKVIEEHVGYQYRDNMTPSKAANIRGQRIENRRRSRKQIREERAAASWTFTKLWDHYVEHRKRENSGKGPTSADVSRYRIYIKHTIGSMRPPELIPRDLEPVHELLKERAAGTRYSALQMINRLSTFGKKQMLCDPIRFHIELPKVDVEQTESLTMGQMERLLQVLHDDGGPVAKAMELALTTGLRRGEIIGLKWADIHFEAGVIKVRGQARKPGRTDHIPLNDAARAVLETLPQDTEYVLQELQGWSGGRVLRAANHLRSTAGLPQDFRPFHGLRHSFASFLASEGVPLYHVSKLLTHQNMQMTRRYSHLSSESLQAASNVIARALDRTNGEKKSETPQSGTDKTD